MGTLWPLGCLTGVSLRAWDNHKCTASHQRLLPSWPVFMGMQCLQQGRNLKVPPEPTSDQIWALATGVQKLSRGLTLVSRSCPSFWSPFLRAPPSAVHSSKTGPCQHLIPRFHGLDGSSCPLCHPPNIPPLPNMLHFPMTRLSSGHQQNSPSFS